MSLTDRGVFFLSLACRLIRLVFVANLCSAQSTSTNGTIKGTIPMNDELTLATLGESFRKASTGAKAVIGEEIVAKMKDVKNRKELVNKAQRLGVFCGLFTISSIFYLVDVLDNDAK